MNSEDLIKIKHRRSLKREQVLLALAKAGDVAISALFKIALIPIALAEVHRDVAKYGMSANTPDLDLLNFEESGIFQDLAEMRIYISHLKRQGLVTEKKKGYVSISNKGLRTMSDALGSPSYARRYENLDTAQKVLTMVIFDIPEKESKKRHWLRYQLKSLKFRYVQHSVWLGQHALPEAFVRDLRKYNLLKHIHIFSIDRSGTISNLLEKFKF